MATMQALNALADAVPVLNKKAAQQGQAQRATQMQAQVGAAAVPAGTSTIRAAQTAAPGAVAAEGAAAVNEVNANTQALTDVAGTALAAKGAAADESLQRQQTAAATELAAQDRLVKSAAQRNEIAMRKRVTGKEQASAERLQKVGIETDNKLQVATIRQRRQLDALGGDVRAQILDSRLQFERDDMGRKFANERQLADYVTANAKTELEFKAHLREVEQASERKLQLMEIAERKLTHAVKAGWDSEQSYLNNENRSKIAKMAADMRERIAKESSARKGRMAMWQAGGTIVGAVVGGVIGGGLTFGAGAGAGAAVGASVGGGLGTAAGGYVEDKRG